MPYIAILRHCCRHIDSCFSRHYFRHVITFFCHALLAFAADADVVDVRLFLRGFMMRAALMRAARYLAIQRRMSFTLCGDDVVDATPWLRRLRLAGRLTRSARRHTINTIALAAMPLFAATPPRYATLRLRVAAMMAC